MVTQQPVVETWLPRKCGPNWKQTKKGLDPLQDICFNFPCAGPGLGGPVVRSSILPKASEQDAFCPSMSLLPSFIGTKPQILTWTQGCPEQSLGLGWRGSKFWPMG